jgi:hypothetical protein
MVAHASAYGLVLSCDERGLRVESATGQPVPAAFRSVLVTQKAELLEFLTWQDEADQMVLDTTRSIALEYSPGCPLDTEEWAQHDAALHVAFWSGDLSLLRSTLAERERFAHAAFAEYRSVWRAPRSGLIPVSPQPKGT